jgi:2-amino-4-hydroxy-6-hydroxymethyldihydropteridine diphosphokinase
VKHTAFFSLGSNQGDRLALLEQALDLLAEICDDLTASRVYETEPMHVKNQARFLNLAAKGKTVLDPRGLLDRIGRIERRLGRRRGLRFGPRPIDIDILFFEGLTVADSRLIIPHPRITQRRFVLIPLLEIEPGLVDPVSGEMYWKSLLRAPAGGVYFHAWSRYTVPSLIQTLTGSPPDPGKKRR